MADETDAATPLGLPMQPTGSGIADLEIEREKAAIAKGEIEAEEAATAPFGDVTASGGE